MDDKKRIESQLRNVLDKIAAAASAAGRDPSAVKLVAVSKTFPAADVLAAFEAGQTVFGENKVQELEEKAPVLPAGIEWHLIGHLQGNKAVKAVQLASCIHSIDSEKLLLRVARLAGELGKKPDILLEINVSGEDSKFGLTPDDAMRAAETASQTANITFKGLMTMAPFDASPEELSKVFSGLRKLRDRMEKEFSRRLPELSMGMSADFEAAIKEGATIVRVGSAIFGKRDYNL